MKLLITIFAAISFAIPVAAQYYIRGDVRDETGNALQNVKIYMPLTHLLYSSGSTGGFGIPTPNLKDSLIFSLDGYETKSIVVKSSEYQKIVLQTMGPASTAQKQKLISLTTGSNGNIFPVSYYMNESYSSLAENDFIKTTKETKTRFSMRIDKASYSNIRRFINQDTKVPVDAVRVDEMLNYFNFNYQEPAPGEVFKLTSQLTDCPWNRSHQLLFLNLSARKLDLEKVPPSNLVFLIDVSGSMDLPNRLPLLKQAFQLLVKNLRNTDTVSIVTYGGSVGIWLAPTSGANKDKIIQSIERLNASGDTPGEAAIRTAYKLAQANYIQGGNNRIILATDGDFNIGQSSEKELEDLISEEKQSGVVLTCLGVGMGNYKDSKIEVLAKKGNGNFAYIDDIREAEKVMVTEFTQTMYSVASNVFVNASFNPKFVSEYRLIGYDNKKTLYDSKDFELEGGEIGSGTGNTILFEIVPRAADSSGKKATSGVTIAEFQVHFHVPDKGDDQTIGYTAIDNYQTFANINKELQFAGAVAMFGLKLRESKYFPENIDWNFIKNTATAALTPGNYIESEFISLVEKTRKIYGNKKRWPFSKKDKD